MPYTLLLRPAADRDRRSLPPGIHQRIAQALLSLEADPRPSGAVKLVGSRDRWRIRVGDYRIIYQIEDSALQVLVLRMVHRREAYR